VPPSRQLSDNGQEEARARPSNVEREFTHRIFEQGHDHPSMADSRMRWVEIIEAIVLATVAVTTAWSGYQASK